MNFTFRLRRKPFPRTGSRHQQTYAAMYR